MDNQHRKIAGYRDLPQEDIDLINAIKSMERAMLGLISTVQVRLAVQDADARNSTSSAEVFRLADAEPKRWAAIAKTHIQEGASALVRAVAQPA